MNNQNFYLRLIALLLIIMAVFFYNGTVKDKEQAQDIADMSRFVKVQEIAHKMNIGKMAEATIKMVTESIDSFVKKDLDSAAAVVKYDNVVDDLFLRVKTELPKLLQQDPQNAEYYIDLIMVAKYFERIGDHAENIAQWVEYSITGTHDE
mgnify:CR=1 FL=1